MRLTPTERSLAATVLLIAVGLAVLSVVCADGVHVLFSDEVGSDCAVMTHTHALGSASGPGVSPLVVSMLIALIGLAGVRTAKSGLHADGHVVLSYGRSLDPLHGRLRL